MSLTACCNKKSATAALEKNAAFLRLIGDENRLRILCLLRQGERCVCEIWKYLGLPQNLTSHHLGVLKEHGMIRARKDGLKVFYSIDQKVMQTHFQFLHHHLWRTQ